MKSSPDFPTEIQIVTSPSSSERAASLNDSEGRSTSVAEGFSLANPAEIHSAILIPRWVVYFQAALLGIVASTFFIFGLMVGCLTNSQEGSVVKTEPCEITGTVQYHTGDRWRPDAGAVVFFLPKQRRPEERSAGNLVSPDGFQPLDNPGIDIVNRLGGAIVRTDEGGKFSVTVDGHRTGVEYFVLVVSKNKAHPTEEGMTRQQVAVIGTFFMPVDRVVNDRAFYWTSYTARSDDTLTDVKF